MTHPHITDEAQKVTQDAAANAALAYAIWDSENTVRMKAEAIQEYIARAESVRHWLKLHEYTIIGIAELESLRARALSPSPGQTEGSRAPSHTEEQPYCPFCKKPHVGGDTCLGHYP